MALKSQMPKDWQEAYEEGYKEGYKEGIIIGKILCMFELVKDGLLPANVATSRITENVSCFLKEYDS